MRRMLPKSSRQFTVDCCFHSKIHSKLISAHFTYAAYLAIVIINLYFSKEKNCDSCVVTKINVHWLDEVFLHCVRENSDALSAEMTCVVSGAIQITLN